MEWHGDEVRFLQLCQLLELGSSPSNAVQQQAFQQLNQFSQLPDFDLYLATVFAKMTAQHEFVRQRAGLLLKENLRRAGQSVQFQVSRFIQLAALTAVRDQSRVIRHTAGTLLTTIVQHVGVQSSLESLDTLVDCCGDGNPDVAEGCFNALSKICEDGVTSLQQNFDAPIPGTQEFVNWCTSKLLPRVFEYASPQAPVALRQNAIECLNHFALNQMFTDGMYSAFEPLAPRYVEVLGVLATDADARVMKEVCKGFVCVVDNKWPCLRPEYCQGILSYMLTASQHSQYEVRLEALEVWTPCVRSEVLQQMVAPMLPALVPVLLANMVFSDADYMAMEQSQLDDDNAAVPDSQEDIKPRFHKEKDAQEEEDAEGGTTWGSEWTARKAAASALDNLADAFQGNLLKLVLPVIEQKLQDANWEVRESAVLALGAIAYGCISNLVEFLPKVMDLLLRLSEFEKPLLRSICCWCVSRFSQWICCRQNKNVLQSVLVMLLKRLLDRNKRVQEAACSALATLEEEAQSELAPFVPEIVRTFAEAFRLYQAKNILALYDAVGTLAEAVGSDLAEPRSVEVLMVPLIERFENTADNDRSLVALFECLTSLAQNLGPTLAQVAPRMVVRCDHLIKQAARAAQMWQENPNEFEKPDHDIMAASISLLSGFFEGMGDQIKQVLVQHNFLTVLPECLRSTSLQVKQCAFALLGDSAKCCCEYLSPLLPELLPLCAKCLRESTSKTVTNNASWAIGEVCIRVGPDVMLPYIDQIILPLMMILNHRPSPQTRMLMQNACITLGRLGLVCASQMGKHFAEFARIWCVVMKDLRQDDEKVTAFQGLCCLVRANPHACMPFVPELAGAIASFRPTPPLLASEFRGILLNYKQALGVDWPGVYAQCSLDLKLRLKQEFNFD